MNEKHVIKYVTAGAFLLLIVTFFVPLLKIWDFDLSVFDFIGISSDLNDMLTEYADYTEFLRQEIADYRSPCILLMILPIIEAVLIFTNNQKVGRLITVLALVINNTLAFILYNNIQSVLSYINESLLGIIFQTSLRVEPLPVAIWTVVHLGILIIVVIDAVREYIATKKERAELEDITDVKEIIMEQFHLNRRKEESLQYEEKEVELMSEKQQEPFYGGIIGKTGTYKEKIYLLKKEEKVSLGSEATDDIYIIGVLGKATLCLISYDIKKEEYHVRPLEKKAVFLESTQPLGKDRVYCIPRGKSLIIDNKKNIFTLA